MKVTWMTEIESRCNHPDDNLVFHIDILDRPYYYCKKCGCNIDADLGKPRANKSLWE